MDRDDLLAEILDAHAPIEAAALLVPAEALSDAAPGMPGFARKDILSHVAWWHDHSVAVLGGVRSGIDPFPEAPEGWDLDAQNAATLHAHRELSPADAAAWEARSFDALVTAVVEASPAELSTPGYRPWLGTACAADIVAADANEHYPEHVPHLGWVKPDADLRLHAAVAAGDLDGVRRLLADSAVVGDRDGDLRTPLHLAVVGSQQEIVAELLRAGAPVDARDGRLDTPFLAAGRSGDVALLTLLATAGADASLTNRYGGTALIPACERGHEAAVAFLLEHTTVDVNHRNRLGWTGLMEAVLLGDGGPVQQRIVRLLLGHGGDPDIADHDGRTALVHARRRGFTGLATILEAAGGHA